VGQTVGVQLRTGLPFCGQGRPNQDNVVPGGFSAAPEYLVDSAVAPIGTLVLPTVPCINHGHVSHDNLSSVGGQAVRIGLRRDTRTACVA
jgi:hypothetical protein